MPFAYIIILNGEHLGGPLFTYAARSRLHCDAKQRHAIQSPPPYAQVAMFSVSPEALTSMVSRRDHDQFHRFGSAAGLTRSLRTSVSNGIAPGPTLLRCSCVGGKPPHVCCGLSF